jgi:hypothetical protein
MPSPASLPVSKALRKMHSWFGVSPRPLDHDVVHPTPASSMPIRMPASVSVLVKGEAGERERGSAIESPRARLRLNSAVSCLRALIVDRSSSHDATLAGCLRNRDQPSPDR